MRLALLYLLVASCAVHEPGTSLPSHLVLAERWEFDLGSHAADSELARMCVWRERENVQGHAVWQLACRSELHEDLVLVDSDTNRRSEEVVLKVGAWSRFDFAFLAVDRVRYQGFRFQGVDSGEIFALVGPHFDPREQVPEFLLDLDLDDHFRPLIDVDGTARVIDPNSSRQVLLYETYYKDDGALIFRSPVLEEEWLREETWSEIFTDFESVQYQRGVAGRKVLRPLAELDDMRLFSWLPLTGYPMRIYVAGASEGAPRLSNRIEFPAWSGSVE